MRETTDNELSGFETTTTPSENATTPSEDYIDTSEICNEDEERLHSIIGDIILIGAQVSFILYLNRKGSYSPSLESSQLL